MKNISQLNWIKAISPNEYDMILDHHMLAGFRMCQSYFELLHIQGRRPKTGYSWALEFGILFHKIIDDIYNWKQKGDFDLERLIKRGVELWQTNNMDRFLEHPTCKSLGGQAGFVTLCLQYVQYYTNDTERLRIVGTEIGFGRDKDVSLGTFYITVNQAELIKVNCYLSGRIDFLAEDGRKIGPVDHKTRAVFGKKDLSIQYNPHEGMSGYIYAAKQLVSKIPEMSHLQTNSAWMNFIQVTNESDVTKRFRRIIVMRTDQQLEQYRIRQVETFRDIFFYLHWDRTATWNTEVCTHWYGSTCIYQPVHRLPDANSQLIVLNNDFTSGEYWNPEEIGDSDNDSPVSRNNTINQTEMQKQAV